MQVWIEETTSIVTYMYGELYNSNSSSATRSIFIASSNTATTAGSITVSATPTFALGTTLASNSFAAGSGTATASPLIANLGSSAQGSRRFFRFTPPSTVSGDVTTLTFTANAQTTTTVNFVDNATNEVGFIVIRATAAKAFAYCTTVCPNTTGATL